MNDGGTNTRHDGEEPIAPAKLVAALKEPFGAACSCPRPLTTPCLAAAAALWPDRGRPGSACGIGFGRGSPGWSWRGFARVADWIYFFAKPGRELAREDLNHDGRVDILDAFQLAREAQSGTKADQGRDLNGDGVVDQRDAEFIAAQAVKLEKGGRS
jgi:hypothetical protein